MISELPCVTDHVVPPASSRAALSQTWGPGVLSGAPTSVQPRQGCLQVRGCGRVACPWHARARRDSHNAMHDDVFDLSLDGYVAGQEGNFDITGVPTTASIVTKTRSLTGPDQ